MEQTAGQTKKNRKMLLLLIQFFTQSFCSGAVVSTNQSFLWFETTTANIEVNEITYLIQNKNTDATAGSEQES